MSSQKPCVKNESKGLQETGLPATSLYLALYTCWLACSLLPFSDGRGGRATRSCPVQQSGGVKN